MKIFSFCIILPCTTVLGLPILPSPEGDSSNAMTRRQDPVSGLVPALSELLGGVSDTSVEKRQDPVKGLVPALSELLGGVEGQV